jgi:hypothetical protein
MTDFFERYQTPRLNAELLVNVRNAPTPESSEEWKSVWRSACRAYISSRRVQSLTCTYAGEAVSEATLDTILASRGILPTL